MVKLVHFLICCTSTLPRATHLQWNFLRRPCCPPNFFLALARGMPTAPPQDAPACVQRLNARALRCLQRFYEKHSQHMLFSEARFNMISQQSSRTLKLRTSRNRTQKSCQILCRKGHLHQRHKWNRKNRSRQQILTCRDSILMARTVLREVCRCTLVSIM